MIDRISLHQRKFYSFQLTFLLSAVCLLVISTRSAKSADSFNLRVPEGTSVAGVFQETRSLQDEYNLLSVIELQSGVHAIPLAAGNYPMNIIRRFEFGPDRAIAQPVDAGTVNVEIVAGNPSSANFRFEQKFDAGGTVISLFIDNLWCNLIDGKPGKEEQVFDEPFLSRELYMMGEIRTPYQSIFLQFASPSYESLPLYRVELSLENDRSIQLYQRWQPALAGTGPARLVYAAVQLNGGNAVQTSYYKLIYSAEHHNWNEKYWILFDAPLGGAYGIAVFAEDFPYRAEVYTLDPNREPLRQIEVISVSKQLFTGDFPPRSSIPSWSEYK